jgi:hypothetical protein
MGNFDDGTLSHVSRQNLRETRLPEMAVHLDQQSDLASDLFFDLERLLGRNGETSNAVLTVVRAFLAADKESDSR